MVVEVTNYQRAPLAGPPHGSNIPPPDFFRARVSFAYTATDIASAVASLNVVSSASHTIDVAAVAAAMSREYRSGSRGQTRTIHGHAVANLVVTRERAAAATAKYTPSSTLFGAASAVAAFSIVAARGCGNSIYNGCRTRGPAGTMPWFIRCFACKTGSQLCGTPSLGGGGGGSKRL